MLQSIIKRDGTKEAYIPSKLNMWGQWASKTLGDRVDWSDVVLETVKKCPKELSSQDLQKQLIKTCIERLDWPHNCMAGKLYAVHFRKELYKDTIPTVKDLFSKLQSLGLMKKLNYTEEQYKEIETIINHDRDFDYAHFQIHQIRKKYSLQDKVKKLEYETPQFTYMRMALALAEDEDDSIKLIDVKNYYDHLSLNRINAPTPNYVNLGTEHNGYASCCLYTVGDSVASLAIGDHIAYTMTYMSAGIGGYIDARSVGDKVRGGLVEHQGKLPYYKSLAGAVKANLQAGRGGACTSYYSAFDPEADTIARIQNPRMTEDKRNRDIHFAMMSNRLFAKKVLRDENIFLFTSFTAPDLMKLFFSGDQDGFEELYIKYDQDEFFIKKTISAREFLITATQQSYEVATHYFALIDEINRHTPHKDTIYSSNLCLEITQPTLPYTNMVDLYTEEDHGRGEVSLCSLFAIIEPNIKSDEEYASAVYYGLKMVDKCIDISSHALPHVRFTAKKRRNAGVGLVGIATTLARESLLYTTKEGKKKMHEIAERHSYFTIAASLRLGKEKGNAPWMHKTKWPEGWLPIDTYKRNVDKIVEPVYKYNWEQLRLNIISNGGIRNSSLIAHMPTESSSKAAGVPNGVYPIRDLDLKKSDAGNIIDWVPFDSDILHDKYQLAYDIPSIDMIENYAILQKFADQAISADLYKDRRKDINLSTEEMVEEYLAMVRFGVKTRYYQNSLTSKGDTKVTDTCASGACSV